MTNERPGGFALPPGCLLACAQAASFPPVPIGRLTVAGRDAWEDAHRRASECERWTLLRGLETALTRLTPGARERLDAGLPDLDTDPVVVGDAHGLELVRDALAFAPPVVRNVAARDAAFLFVGRGSVAWTACASFSGADGRPLPRVVVLGPSAGLKTVLHEAVHLLLRPTDREFSRAVTVDAEASIARLVETDPAWQTVGARFAAERALEEHVCDGLAYLWLYGPPLLPATSDGSPE